MKIGTKLAICFVALAVVPLGAASVVYLRATSEFGAEMAERGKALLAERISRDLRRATELGAVSIEQVRDNISREVRFLAGDIAARLSAGGDDADLPETASGFLLGEETADTAPNGAKRIDLQHMSVHIADDAEHSAFWRIPCHEELLQQEERLLVPLGARPTPAPLPQR